MPSSNGLTVLQRRFINAFLLNGGNATQAALTAGYKGKNGTLRSIGSENLTKPNIKTVIESRLAKEAMSADELIWRIGQTARMDISPYVNSFGRLTGVDLEQLIADGHGHLIKGVKQTKEGSVIEFHDAQKAQDQLLKYYGIDKQDVTVNIDQRQIRVVYADA